MTTTPPPRPHTYTHTFGSASTAVTQLLDALTNDEVCSFYALRPEQTVTIGFHDLELTTNLPAASNGVSTLSVDLSNTSGWQATEAYRKKVFLSCFFNDDGTPKGTVDFNGFRYFSGNKEDVEYLFENILQKAYPAPSDDVTLEIFGMQIDYACYSNSDTDVYFFIPSENGEITFIIYFGDGFGNYEKFEITKLPGDN